MKLYYYRDPLGNFGDDLNLWLWSRLLPKPMDACYDDRTLFVGIGTLLNDRLPAAPQTVVFGTGVGYGPLPNISGRWRVFSVRGRRTAAALGLPGDAVLGDAALLVRKVVEPAGAVDHPVSFMPHHRTAERADWKKACESSAIRYLDPSAPVEQTLEAIRRSGLVIAEAMHGAVVADALRVPWVPVRTSEHILEFKWRDWAETVGVEHRFEWLPSVPYSTTTVSIRRGVPTFVVRDVAAEELLSLARRAPRRLSPEPVFRQVYARLVDAFEALASEA